MKKLCVFILMFLVVGALSAQDAAKSQDSAKSQEPSAKKDPIEGFKMPVLPSYRLAFSVYELQEGKRMNQRDFMLVVNADGNGGNKLRIGTKIPIDAGENKITYTDIGFDLECSAIETVNNKLLVRLELGLSSLPGPEQNKDPQSAGSRPILRAISQRLRAVLTPGKPQIITSVDDVNSNKRFQVEATATKID
jgi:hypothetical protein